MFDPKAYGSFMAERGNSPPLTLREIVAAVEGAGGVPGEVRVCRGSIIDSNGVEVVRESRVLPVYGGEFGEYGQPTEFVYLGDLE